MPSTSSLFAPFQRITSLLAYARPFTNPSFNFANCAGEISFPPWTRARYGCDNVLAVELEYTIVFPSWLTRNPSKFFACSPAIASRFQLQPDAPFCAE